MQLLKNKFDLAYIPIEEDEIDVKLADFLNNYLQRQLPVKFRRIERSLYSFGSCRVIIKIHNNDLFCRIGGNVMTLENFVNLYTL
jgi:hypothetical protein